MGDGIVVEFGGDVCLDREGTLILDMGEGIVMEFGVGSGDKPKEGGDIPWDESKVSGACHVSHGVAWGCDDVVGLVACEKGNCCSLK